MPDVDIKDPVSEVPPIQHDTGHRRSKYDDVLDEAVGLLGSDDPILPVEFKSSKSAHYGHRRIKDRVPIHDHEPGFLVTKRGPTVYVKALEEGEGDE